MPDINTLNHLLYFYVGKRLFNWRHSTTRHHQALAANQREGQAHACAYELALAKLATDKRRLKTIPSIERKIEVKRELLPDYQPWVSGILSADSQQQDDLFITVLLWTLDTGNFPAAYNMTEHALKHGGVTPDQHQRQTACMVAEEVADTARKQLTAGTFEALDSLLTFAGLLSDQDMPDQVRARLHKAPGLAQSESQPREALAQLQRALQLDENVGVKKLKYVCSGIKKSTGMRCAPPYLSTGWAATYIIYSNISPFLFDYTLTTSHVGLYLYGYNLTHG